MQLKKAERKKVKLKLGIAGPSGSGKTYSALLLAKGLVGEWGKVAIIDTENGSGSLYVNLGAYGSIELHPPFEPEQYMQAIDVCIAGGIEAIIIDSMTAEWSGEGGVLDYQSKLGGRFQDWAKATPRHRKFVDHILQAPAHIICCTRVKTEWALEDNDKGKKTPIKMGLKMEQRDGLEYELTVAWRLSQTNMASVDKDRTGLFTNRADFKISENTGRELAKWANEGIEETPVLPVTYNNTIASHRQWLLKTLQDTVTPKELWKEIAGHMEGNQMTKEVFDTVRLTTGVFSAPSKTNETKTVETTL